MISKIFQKRWINSSTVYLELELEENDQNTFQPGQFLHIRCGDAQLLRRPISICDWGTSGPCVAFEIRGAGTKWLAGQNVGTALDILGPLGNGFAIQPQKRYLLVGGGIGVSPLLGCARYIHETSGQSIAALGFQSSKKAILLDQFEQYCSKTQIATDDGSLGFHGFVDGILNLHQDRDYSAIFVCGPKPMLRQIAKAAQIADIPCQVSMEERMGCGVGACLVCACDMQDGSRKRVCKDGPVFDAQEVNWDA